MSHCDVTYYKIKDGLQNTDDVITIPSFMPTSRTFVLKPLEANETYSFAMTCQDLTGTRFSTRPMVLKTSKNVYSRKILPFEGTFSLWRRKIEVNLLFGDILRTVSFFYVFGKILIQKFGEVLKYL